MMLNKIPIALLLCLNAHGNPLDQAEKNRVAGDYATALQAYEKKLTEGGSEQELFWSSYCIGLMQEYLHAEEGITLECYHRTYERFPYRAEPLYRLAALAAQKKQYLTGYLLSKYALSLPIPNSDQYIDRSIYDYGLKMVYGDCAYGLEKFIEAGNAYGQISIQSSLPLDILTAAQKKLQLCNAKGVWTARKYEGVRNGEMYEQNRLDLIAKFIPQKPVILEAGGHEGNDTLKFLEKWPHAKIFSFEPNPFTYQKLSHKTQDFSSVRCLNLALAPVKGSMLLHLPYSPNNEAASFAWQTGACSLLSPLSWMSNLKDQHLVNVPTVVLDDWCRENQVAQIDFMWLDLEGVELSILQSSPQILKTVKAIYTETNLQEFREGTTLYPALRAFLENAGFKLVAHWYADHLQGDALFVKQELYEQVKD